MTEMLVPQAAIFTSSSAEREMLQESSRDRFHVLSAAARDPNTPTIRQHPLQPQLLFADTNNRPHNARRNELSWPPLTRSSGGSRRSRPERIGPEDLMVAAASDAIRLVSGQPLGLARRKRAEQRGTKRR